MASPHADPCHLPELANEIPRRTVIKTAITTAASCVFASGSMGADDPVSKLIRLAEDKNAAFMRGEMERWAEMADFTSDFTLMQPFGGPASHGFDKSPGKLAEMSRYFQRGEATLEVAKTYASDELIVLVTIERQRGEVGGLPAQDWSLRVTEVYRKAGSEWRLAHRHADPLVRRMTLTQTAAIARGQS